MIRLPAILTAGIVSACGAVPEGPGQVAPDADQSRVSSEPDGLCYGRVVTPAVIETVTEQVVERPAILNSDGSVRSPATFRTATHQRILSERREVTFEAVCTEDLTPEFIASLQRALAVRGSFGGVVTGTLDRPTTEAIRSWQTARGGPDSPVLAMTTARQLGLVALSGADLGL